MSERGVFAVDRGFWTDPDFPNEPFTEREAFLWLVSEAAWRETKARVGSVVIELKRGQCAFSTRFMAAKFQWAEARVRRFLKRRADLGQLCTKTDAGATQITICKYDAFQRVGTVSDAAPTQERRSTDAKKKQGNRETEPSTEPDGSSDGERAERANNPSTPKPSAVSELRHVLDAKHAADVVEHRKRMGSPLTASAAAKLAAKLAKWPDPNEAADEMMANGWQGFEADWLAKRRGQGPPANSPSGTVTPLPSRGYNDRSRPHRPTQAEQLDAAFERRYGYRAGNN